MITELTKENCFEYTRKGFKVVEFHTSWCFYCKKQKVELENFINSDIEICTCDAEVCSEFAQSLKVEAFPTFIILKNGKKIGEIVGLHEYSDLMNILMEYV